MKQEGRPCMDVLSFGGKFDLVALPSHFHQLLKQLAKERCRECNVVRGTDGAVCLLCGALVCFGQDSNCHIKHMRSSCDGSNGIFLTVKRCDVMLVQDDKKANFCYWGSLYLDDYGEEDLHLRRGRALRLSQSRMEQLRMLYLSVGMNDFISRHMQPWPSNFFTIRIR